MGEKNAGHARRTLGNDFNIMSRMRSLVTLAKKEKKGEHLPISEKLGEHPMIGEKNMSE